MFVAVVMAFTVGFIDGFNTFLALYRVAYFFPMFIVGYYCPDLSVVLQKASKYKYCFIGISLACLAVIFMLSYNSQTHNSYISQAYTPITNYNGSVFTLYLRAIGFVSSCIISIGFLYMVPSKKNKFTYIGENTMNIYLLHMFIAFPLGRNLVDYPPYLILLISFAASILICLLFSSRVANSILNPFTKFKEMELLLKKLR